MILLAFLMGMLAMLLMIFLWRERTRQESHYKRLLKNREGKK